MRHRLFLVLATLLALGLTACGGSSKSDDPAPRTAQCADGIDNDGDNLVDHPADPGCTSPDDNDETSPVPEQCRDGLDNDQDGKIDHPDDPGCSSPTDNDETDPTAPTACSDGVDNDLDGKIDFPDDPGCNNAADNDETDPITPTACSDGVDNDLDGKIDFPDDPGCDNAADNDETDPVAAPTRTRYEMSSAIPKNGQTQCWALKSNGNGNFVVRNAGGYAATATDIANAEAFFMKPSALGKYLFYNRNRQLMSVGTAPSLTHIASANATDNSEWTVIGVGDTTIYPPAPEYNVEPSAAQVSAYHNFAEPNLKFSAFTIRSNATNTNLASDASGALVAAAPASTAAQSFSFEPTTGCSNFPEASSDVVGTSFKGKRADGTVLGHADVHVHISATTFLGGAHWGTPFHKFGVEHALGNCAEDHGDSGQLDLVGGVFTQDPDGHATDGWPTFSEWPARDNLIHEAIYWKWLERAWASGLRVVVNDLVDNETLCELQRNATGNPLRECNSMNTAGQQAGTMYAMQDYIDAQYGGRKQGFFQITHTPAEGRAAIENGNIAVILGIEISEVLNCKVKYSPLRTERPFEETGSGGRENSYTCTRDSIVEQLDRLKGWGVRQIISVHEFDNAFGGNGIFDGLILNLGNREDTGGIPSGDIASIVSLFSPDTNPELFQRFVENLPTTETPTGEWWTTYNCPIEGGANATPGFSGYLWSNSGGSVQSYLSPPLCVFTGQEGRAGGTTPCYPANIRQCNARWMTPIGQFAFGKMMEKGFIIDWDHMEMGTKTQLLELTEAQTPAYPIVSTHGTFGGATISQTRRQLANGGFVYPSNGSSRGFRGDMNETVGVYNTAVSSLPPDQRPLFGFGYGTDTNGLSAQTGPRNKDDPNVQPFKPVVYPFTLFKGGVFDDPSLTGMFSSVTGVQFQKPVSKDLDGTIVREWNEDTDGNAHYGMLSDFVQEIALEGNADHIRHLFNSAEAFLQTWERTQASSNAINTNGLVVPNGVLREAPKNAPYSATDFKLE
jgi:hypothetical protein